MLLWLRLTETVLHFQHSLVSSLSTRRSTEQVFAWQSIQFSSYYVVYSMYFFLRITGTVYSPRTAYSAFTAY